jgi:hypothetical protein
MVRDPEVVHLVKSAGYKFVFFPSGFQVTRSRNANADVTVTRSAFSLSEFDRVFLTTTIFARFDPGYSDYKDNLLYAFDQLPKVAEMKEPTFTFAHITMPHMPYVFDANGKALPLGTVRNEPLTKEDYRRLYVGQLGYLNKRMQGIVDDILAKSKTPPIIIIQGDHGMKWQVKADATPSLHLKRCILSAYYLPGDGEKLLYPTISPVNTFRIVFNHYLGGHFKLFKDTSYEDIETRGKLTFKPIKQPASTGNQ